MRTNLLVPTLLVAACTSTGRPPAAGDRPDAWDMPRISSTFEAAHRTRAAGDPLAAERLCHAAFDAVDAQVLSGYDAYVGLLAAQQRTEESTMRDRVARLRVLRAERLGATQPTSSYLGFSPTQDLDGYAAVLQSLGRSDEARHARSVAQAYRHVQEAHVQRTVLYQSGKDPRGVC